LNDTEEVIAAYKVVAKRLLDNPDDPEQLSNQFTLLTGRGPRSPSHLTLAKRCAAIAPDNFTAVFNLGSAHLRAAEYREGLEVFVRALKLAPPERRSEALHHIGLAWETLGQFDTAIQFYDQAIDLNPNDPELRQSRALSVLESGKLAEGLFDFECKYFKPPRKPIAQAGIPRWLGEPLDDKHIIVHHEQGFGDTIQFCRFIAQIKAKKVTVAMPPSLMGLVQSGFKADAWVSEEGPFKADYYCSPMSACGALKVEYGHLSGAPYFHADPIKLPKRGKLKVGLVWRGSSGYSADVERSMSLADLCPLLEIPGAAFYSLQVGEASKEISHLGFDGFIGDLTGLIKDWKDTARAIEAMDLIVSVDTAVAHLAGALGKPTFTLLPWAPAWRWLRGTNRTPFYDSMRLFRQDRPNDWTSPVGAVATKLRGLV
jgi:tetratricopeptide (TPR) repeat protein